MPRIVQYSAETPASWQVAGGQMVAPVDTSGLMRGVGAVGLAAENLRRHQEVMAAQLNADEAKVAVSNVISKAHSTWAEKLQQAQTGAAPGAAGFTDGVLKDFDAFAEESAKQVPEIAQPLLAQQLAHFRQGLHADAFRFEVGARNQKLAGDVLSGADEDARTAFAQPSQATTLMARRLATIEAIELPAEAKARLSEKVKESISYSAASAMAERDPEAFLARVGVRGAKVGKDGKPVPVDEAAAAEAVSRDPLLASMSPQALRSVVDRATMISETRKAQAQAEADRRARQAEIDASRRERAATQAFSILSTRAMSGVATDEKADAPLLAAIAGTPYAAEYRRQVAQVAGRTAVAMLPLAQQQAQIDSLMQQRNTNGTNTELEDEIKTRRDVLARAKSMFDESPLRAGQQFGLYNVSPLDTSSLDGMVRTIGARAAQADVAARQAGRPASPLLPEEVGAVGDALAQLPPGQRAGWTARLASQLPPAQTQALAQQLAPKNKSLALMLAAGADRTNTGRFTAEWIDKGHKALVEKSVKEDETPGSGLIPSIAKEVGDALAGPARSDVIEAARLIWLGQKADGYSPTAAGAVRLALGGDLVDLNGKRVPVPAGMGLDGLRDRLTSMPAAKIAAQASDGWVYSTEGRPMGVPEFLAELPSAQLDPVGLGRYTVRSGAGVATNKAGRPIVIEVR